MWSSRPSPPCVPAMVGPSDELPPLLTSHSCRRCGGLSESVTRTPDLLVLRTRHVRPERERATGPTTPRGPRTVSGALDPQGSPAGACSLGEQAGHFSSV